MSNFDINRHRVIGVAKVHEQYSNAGIYILGYEDDDHHFVGFTETEASEIFKPRGKVFAKNFAEKNSHRANTLISISVEVDLNYDEENKLDKYRLSSRPRDYAMPVPYLNDNDFSLTDNNHNSVIKASMNTSDVFIKSKERLYKRYNSHKDTGVLCYWVTNELFENRHKNVVCSRKKLTYIIREDKIQTQDGYVDIFSDNEIILYVIDLIKDIQLPLDEIDNLPIFAKKLDVPEEILVSRLNRFKSILSMYSFTHNQIMQIASNPIMEDALQRSIKEYEDEYIQMYESRNRDKIQKLKTESESIVKEREAELQNLEKEHRNNISKIEKEVKQKEYERDQVLAQISKRTKEADALEVRLETINEQKGRLIEDFSIIKDVLGGTPSRISANNQAIQRAVITMENEGTPFEEQAELIDHLKLSLKNNQLNTDIAPNIIRPFIGRNRIGHNADIMLFPSIKLIKSFIDTLGMYNILSVTVGANWKSYDDLYMGGLGQIIKSAISNPERVHILLLQNMNLSYVSQYMQPINDVLYGIADLIPTTEGMIKYPSNLWIFGTRTEEEALPMSLDVLKEYCCIERKDYNVEEEEIEELPSKYISMELIEKLRAEEYSYKSHPETYLD